MGSGKDSRGERITSLTPKGHRGDRGQTGSVGGMRSHGGYDPDFLGPPNPIDELVAALCDAGLNTNPKCWKCHGLDPDSDSDSDDGSRPRVRIPPPIFKGLTGERPDAHLLATEDWMEAMRVKPDDYIDKFKHTLQHLATMA